MPDYPIVVQIENRLCVVIGGGAVGLRKVRGLLEAGARVRLISADPVASDLLPEKAPIEILQRPYRNGDLQGAALAFAATSDRQTNQAVAREAAHLGIPANLADSPAQGSFTLPAVLRRGGLTIAVSTGGGSPALAALVKGQLEATWGPEWETVLEVAAALRQKRLTEPAPAEYNQGVLRCLLDSNLPALIADGKLACVDQLLEEHLGKGCTLSALGIHLPKGMT